uniref:Uncharacterized protein n=1 Tax=Romanomermis culicivorax TaxID=13658 RepID=A0A915HW22_ROMCU
MEYEKGHLKRIVTTGKELLPHEKMSYPLKKLLPSKNCYLRTFFKMNSKNFKDASQKFQDVSQKNQDIFHKIVEKKIEFPIEFPGLNNLLSGAFRQQRP